MNLYKRCACAEDRCDHPFWFRYRLHGLEVRESSQTDVHKVALEIARTNRTDRLRKKAGVIPDTVPAITLGALVTRYQAHCRDDHPATAARDARVLEVFRDRLGAATPIDTITAWQITAWRASRVTTGKDQRARTRQTVERDMHTIRGLFLDGGQVAGRYGPARQPVRGDCAAEISREADPHCDGRRTGVASDRAGGRAVALHADDHEPRAPDGDRAADPGRLETGAEAGDRGAAQRGETPAAQDHAGSDGRAPGVS